MNIESVEAAGLGPGSAKYVSLSVGTSVYRVAPPSGAWGYLHIINTHTTAVVKVCINEDPVDAPAASPGVAGDWEAGYPVGPGGDVMIRLLTAPTSINCLSDTATTTIILGLVA